jgi:hypothetical protein
VCVIQDRGEGVFIPEEDVADDDEQVLYTYRNMNILLSII